MRSTVDLVVEAGRTGDTRVTRLRHEGAVATRIAGVGVAATVHLVGTAAGPMAGDTVVIGVRVGPGAQLVLRSVAAALVLPGPPGSDPGTPASVSIEIDVAQNGYLDLDLQPSIVTAQARLSQATTVDLHPDATLRLREHLVSGRHDEAGGAWSVSLDVVRGELPVLRQLMNDGTAPARVVTSGLDLGPGAGAGEPPQPHSCGDAACGAVVCRLAAGGWATTAWGPDLTSTRAALGRIALAGSA